jgi:hypothetical protein
MPQPGARAPPLLQGSGPSPFDATHQPSSGPTKAEDLRPNPRAGTWAAAQERRHPSRGDDGGARCLDPHARRRRGGRMARSRRSRRATAMGMATPPVDPAATPGRGHSRGPTRTITGTRTAAAPAVTDRAIPPPTPFASSHEAARRNGAGPVRPFHGARQRHCSRLSAGAREWKYRVYVQGTAYTVQRYSTDRNV